MSSVHTGHENTYISISQYLYLCARRENFEVFSFWIITKGVLRTPLCTYPPIFWFSKNKIFEKKLGHECTSILFKIWKCDLRTLQCTIMDIIYPARAARRENFSDFSAQVHRFEALIGCLCTEDTFYTSARLYFWNTKKVSTFPPPVQIWYFMGS